MPQVTIDRTVHSWTRRWWWEVAVPAPGASPLWELSGFGYTTTRLGARFAAWRCTRRSS